MLHSYSDIVTKDNRDYSINKAILLESSREGRGQTLLISFHGSTADNTTHPDLLLPEQSSFSDVSIPTLTPTMSPSSSDLPKIQKLTNAKGFALWSIYVQEMMRKDNVLHVLTEDLPEHASQSATTRFMADDRKARAHVVLNLGEEPATLITLITNGRMLLRKKFGRS